MFESEVLRTIFDEEYLSVQIMFKIVLAHVELEDEGLSGLSWNKRRI